MQWIITQDLINTDPGEATHVGFGRWTPQTREFWQPGATCRAEFTLGKRLEWAATLPFEMRLLDDDGIVYYVGMCGDITLAPEHLAFAPLDWSMADAGCTELQFRKAGSNAEWETL
ncbi:hypothetical protein ACODYM_28930 [Burkholderia gladioli]|uniref:hypothetical protein n=1 Tax=Burkholderia gladioli TaxID=28095 RepID=UPI003B5065C3